MKGGMTVVELIAAMAILIIVVGIVFSVYAYAFPKLAFFDRHWPGQRAAQFSAFAITKYLHNASTAVVNPITYDSTGYYIILDKNILYRRVVNDTVSTETITKNVQSVSFKLVGGSPSLRVELSVQGIGSATFTTDVFLNNYNLNGNASSNPGTVLFFK